MARLSCLFRISAVTLNLLIYGLTWNLYLSNQPIGVPVYWKTQFFMILIISSMLAVLVRIITVDWLTAAGLILRGMLALVAINSMPEYMPVYAPLIAVILFEIFLSASLGVSIGSCLLIIALMTCERYLTNQTWGYIHQAPSVADFFLPWGECAIAMICGIVIRQLLDKVHHLSDQVEQFYQSNIRLVEANLGLQDYTVRHQRESIMNERNRISREIHDSVGYMLTNLIAVLDYSRELIIAQKDQALEKIDQGREQARAALAEVRRAVRALRPPIEVSRLQAVSALITAFSEATGIEASVYMPKLPDSFGEEIDTIIYRVIQEALTNTFRHGQATHVFISINLKNKLLSITIKDNGLGATSFQLGCGLTGIQERVRALNGRFEIDSSPNQGFIIKILIPWLNEYFNDMG
ncbi:signal transduction histidine kinase [Hydrogenispora ethanolica]|jgi:signal transduction histidine kinase|uniref:histidine kinase n=1 Tax=Hydrogenispora ethanolica TaxID=1082276 RepID=A0A4R1QL24_HYDET|nr:sensor histidine kinase [Hydrogenispora ethanolica]TCL53613.1 signal transduction histidine kinase [Hydrogenispora ethanolica]